MMKSYMLKLDIVNVCAVIVGKDLKLIILKLADFLVIHVYANLEIQVKYSFMLGRATKEFVEITLRFVGMTLFIIYSIVS